VSDDDMNDEWWDEREVLVSVAEHAIEQGDLNNTATDVLRLIEKPWNYQSLYDAWIDSDINEGK
jgi:hypothetical protein